MPEKTYEENAWLLLAALGVIALIFSLLIIAGIQVEPTLFQNLLGRSLSSFSASDPGGFSALLDAQRAAGFGLLGYSILLIGVSYTSFRRGERWAWYATLYLPLFILYATVNAYVHGDSIWPLYTGFLLVSLATLLLPYRKFFPKK